MPREGSNPCIVSWTQSSLLRQASAERNIEIAHSDSLELIAWQFGMANWNMLSAKIERASPGFDTLPDGWFKAGKSPSSTTPASIRRMARPFSSLPSQNCCTKSEAMTSAP
ncbi:glyoxalase superfamily protein [Devosia psychrophila]|uniref:glyoxalase superfamily protein n=1 Tax=Devosia psychrophila TaxID=728005 RepID=UPI003D09E345